MTSALATIENAIGSLAMLAMVVLPLAEIVFRRATGQGLPGSGPIVQHLTRWVGFLGAAKAGSSARCSRCVPRPCR